MQILLHLTGMGIEKYPIYIQKEIDFMVRTTLNWNVSKIQSLYEKNETLSFSHCIQRASNIWLPEQQSLLIDSILRDYLIPAVVILKQDNLDSKGKQKFLYYVIDGKQRLTNTINFCEGEYPLTDDLPPVVIDEEEYDIAGKYFCELAEPVQYEIKRYKFQLVCFENCTNEEIEQIFYRLNNGSGLTKSQKSKALAGINISTLVNELLSSKFFSQSCYFSATQLRNADNQKALFQAMMLLDRNYINGFSLVDFSEKSIEAYAKSIHDDYKQIDTIKSAVEFLSDAFSEKSKHLKKISIPMVIYLADYSIDKEISPRHFCKWFSYFTEKDESYADYKFFGGTGSTKLEKVDARLAIMAKSFCKFYNLDLPEELADLVDKTDKLLEERKAMLAGETAGTEDSTPEQTSSVVEGETENVIPFAKDTDSSVSDLAEQENAVAEETGTSVQEESDTTDKTDTHSEETETSDNEADSADQAENEADQAEDETEDNSSNAE